VQSAAKDVLTLLRDLKMFPHMLVGHSFGGKVVMSMAQQFGASLPRPVQAWVLDTLPGEVRAGGPGRQDHPADLIATLRRLPLPIADRNAVVDYLLQSGFSLAVARWVTTNLRPLSGSNGLRWTFDLEGIAEMYDSYEDTSLWELLEQPPQGLQVDFVRAERSNFRWEGGVADSIEALGHPVHLLRDAGHWVHTDNPGGLFDIMSKSFGVVDLHLERAVAGKRRR
jgi:pimeloyl-ACP methyl ester carboxylesterase